MSLKTRGDVYDALPAVLPDALPFNADASVPDVPALSAETERQVMDHSDVARLRRLVRGAVPGRELRPPGPAGGPSQTIDTTTGEIISTYSSADEPLGVTYVRCGNRRAIRVPVLLAAVCGGHVPPDPSRRHWRQDGPGVGGGEPAGVRHLDRAVVRDVHGHRDDGRRCHPVHPRPALCRHGRSRTCHDAPRLTMTTVGGAAAVPGLLRLRLPRGVAVVGAGPVAPVHHRPAPAPRQDLASRPPGSPRWRPSSTPRSPSTSAAA